MKENTVIKVEQLVKKYGSLYAVDHTSFSVTQGEIFGLLGENGAGKTTTLEILEGIRQPTSGEVTVLGHDVGRDLAQIKNRIGVQLQSSAYYNYLTLREILVLFAGFYRQSLDAMELLTMVRLEEKANAYVGQLSGGQKQRFSIIASLVNDPEIVFLDEPTTGLDPLARRNLWQIINSIKERGKTVILTTHYMEEAEILCDRIAIMDHGKIVALNTTKELIGQCQMPFKVSIEMSDLEKDAKLITALKSLGDLTEATHNSKHFELHLASQAQLNKAIKLLSESEPEGFSVSRATLEDTFIELTGKSISEDESADTFEMPAAVKGGKSA